MAAPITFVMALKQETASIPIVMYGTREPVRVGVITSLARPGGNITGLAWFGLFSKQMELLKEIVPHMRRVAYIAEPNPPPPEVIKVANEDFTSAASTLGFTWQFFRLAIADDYDKIFARSQRNILMLYLFPASRSIPKTSRASENLRCAIGSQPLPSRRDG
jgi:putative ABC transport system substrate-binding protein